jgi:hypothetical protein
MQTVKVTNVSPKATQHDIMDFFSFSGEIQNIELERSVFHFSKKHLQLSLTGNLYAAVASKDCNLGTPSTDQFCGKPSRDGGGSQVAYVTFKEAQALDTALLLSGAVIVDQAVNIFPLEDEVQTASTTTSMRSEHKYTESRVCSLTLHHSLHS